MTAHKPTDEQQAIIEAAQTGGSLIIEAGAGTGKTSTLRFIAESLAPKRGLYMAYNKAIQVEADGSFPENVSARTAHSVAYAQFGRKAKYRMNAKRISAAQYASILHLSPFHYQHDGESFEKSPRQSAVIIREAVARFCNSADREPSKRHIPFDCIEAEHFDKYASFLAPFLRTAWQDIDSPNGSLTFTHDCYLKQWSLANMDNPKALPYDFILFDEAQDANPCIAVVVQVQDAQVVMVGDSAQAIYGWRGAVDAMKNFTADHHLYLSQSFRFGQAVADEANRLLALIPGTVLRLTGFDQVASVVEPVETPDCILCRTNAGCITAALEYQERGLRVAIVGGTKEIESFCFAALKLQKGEGTDHAQLGAFKDWAEVQEAVEQGEASDLGMLVRLVDNYGASNIINVCKNSVTPDEADMVVSTAHKAKGLEWDKVRIHNDFKPPKDGSTKVSVPELMLMYVAVTRAKLELDMLALAWLADIEAEIAAALDTNVAGL